MNFRLILSNHKHGHEVELRPLPGTVDIAKPSVSSISGMGMFLFRADNLDDLYGHIHNFLDVMEAQRDADVARIEDAYTSALEAILEFSAGLTEENSKALF